MPTAYNHLPPFKRLCNFVATRIGELRAAMSELEAQIKMWNEPEVQQQLRNLPDFLANRIDTAKAKFQELKTELSAWLQVEEGLHKCTGCKGKGEYYINESQDSGHYEKCVHCSGTGKNPNYHGVV